MKDSQPGGGYSVGSDKYIKESNERFSTGPAYAPYGN